MIVFFSNLTHKILKQNCINMASTGPGTTKNVAVSGIFTNGGFSSKGVSVQILHFWTKALGSDRFGPR